MYLLEGYKGTEKIMGVILSAAYIVAKGSDILQRVKFLKRSFIKFLQKTVSNVLSGTSVLKLRNIFVPIQFTYVAV